MDPLSSPAPATDFPPLRRADLDASPFLQFRKWFEVIVAAKLPEPNAMTLATATKQGVPSARIVLLKGFDESGFVFFTNYNSQKGRELEENPSAALVFFWPTFGRQVRIIGTVTRTSRSESEAYFKTRPIGSRLGAWASNQSEIIPTREALEARYAEWAAKFPDDEIPLPPFWGGFRLRPDTLEFWQARLNRLHDRFRYTRKAEDEWRIDRISP
ncbi:MAG: pyridoxamine 5'-phosphate oxidase [Verrucomicrobiota bacterium]